MRIEELIIDGFKSYPVRTHVSGFDASFNAITGLNGSGKSNILDSICFVLGITNLSAVRATNLQDLIYKRGQAGVTKASVTIVFDNTDRARSPVSFENYGQITVTRQIAMGGLSKYLINGHKATQQAVQNMFQSVQLNINNPNFLIMQGKITKVLNMKPQEILSMIEEAAGTRMFEDRKEKAIKTMGKKDQKVKEISSLLEEEITPKLDRLREEKRSFLEYQRATTELERLTRLAKAYEWQQHHARHAEKSKAVETRSRQIQEAKETQEALKRQMSEIEKELDAIEKRREKEMTKGGKLQELTEKSKALQHDLVKAKTLFDLRAGSLDEETKKLQADEVALNALASSRQEKGESLRELSESFGTLKAAFDGSNDALSKQDELLQSLLTGMASKASDGAQGGYMGQLADARAREAAAGTEVEQAKLRIGHLQKELKTKEPLARKAEKEGAGLVQELANARDAVNQLQGQVESTGWDEGKERALSQTRAEVSQKVSELLTRRDAIKSRLAALDFSYSDPEPNFNRSKVKGLVASLTNLDEDKHRFSTALEVCAGGRLYNVVVEDEKTGSQLLANGKLKKRVTLIPLNKITATVAAAERIGAAKKLAPGKVDLALSLVGYDDEVCKAMEFVFGSTLICADAETAKRVTFDGQVHLKSVTLDGDVYDPAGTLSGGSKPNTAGVLVQMQELNRLDRQVAEAKRTLARCDAEAKAAKDAIAKFNNVKRQLDLKKHEVTLLEGQVSGSNATRIISRSRHARSRLKSSLLPSLRQREAEAGKGGGQVAREGNGGVQLEQGLEARGAQGRHQEAQGRQPEAGRNHQGSAGRGVKHLEAQFEWIVTEQDFFGKAGTAYDFERHNMREVGRTCKKLEEQQSGMKKKVNPKVLNMIDSVEKKESELKTMMSTVLKDKGKIEDTIEELDRYKKDALQTTWEKVNGDFGDIFGELLPGNYAKLQPPEGMDVTQGLEVKVRLGSVWKQSLTELSGGQRSLIALSLIMSLLQFKPAPMYILDEIDAALDLSHTQHIGQLFKSRFSGSQFIVVSLKEGLFTNANVLFRPASETGRVSWNGRPEEHV
ncbi:hypothetical protein L7F22_002485 [Adiantum nelumboides]|nr:hypothetical protein [Adiantum nelumboides]